MESYGINCFEILLSYKWHPIILTSYSCRMQWFLVNLRDLCSHHPNPVWNFSIAPEYPICSQILRLQPPAPGNSWSSRELMVCFLSLWICLFWAFYMNWIKNSCFMHLAFSTYYNGFWVHPCGCMWPYFMLFIVDSSVLYGCPTFVYPFTDWLTLGLFPVWEYYKHADVDSSV